MFEALAVLLGIGFLLAVVGIVGAVLHVVLEIVLFPFKLIGVLVHAVFGLVGGILGLVLVVPILLLALPVLLVLGVLALPLLLLGLIFRPCPL